MIPKGRSPEEAELVCVCCDLDERGQRCWHVTGKRSVYEGGEASGKSNRSSKDSTKDGWQGSDKERVQGKGSDEGRQGVLTPKGRASALPSVDHWSYYLRERLDETGDYE